jgi:hypothetical protein
MNPLVYLIRMCSIKVCFIFVRKPWSLGFTMHARLCSISCICRISFLKAQVLTPLRTNAIWLTKSDKIPYNTRFHWQKKRTLCVCSYKSHYLSWVNHCSYLPILSFLTTFLLVSGGTNWTHSTDPRVRCGLQVPAWILSSFIINFFVWAKEGSSFRLVESFNLCCASKFFSAL